MGDLTSMLAETEKKEVLDDTPEEEHATSQEDEGTDSPIFPFPNLLFCILGIHFNFIWICLSL